MNPPGIRVRRRELQAYVIGAAVAGTALVVPYWGRAMIRVLVRDLVAEDVPFFLLPIAWGVWNWIRVRADLTVSAAVWGALLGALLSTGVNVLLWSGGTWTPVDAVLLVWLPTVYAFGWVFVIEPLNRALGASTPR